ncbi:transcription initiation protein [Desertihabitans brevis]|uniref:Transcription initiation protein n=1 Tax=Desertihabitans brevis TaxID=2268447 RepID=A0A367YWA6_9ACTN|nr:YciI family protein [Desertihabitans brevis]RCK69292.1 transcription initiation protein [Desertihabitans brevis]
MSVEYAVLLPGDERPWVEADQATRDAVYARHTEFARLLTERGHTITGGAELEHSSRARVVRGERGSVTVTEGPYAETVEQLTGFYLVRTDDLDDLLDLCGLLAGGGAVEVRTVVPDPQPATEAGAAGQAVGS